MKCYLCPRNCGADRDNGEIGFCGETNEIVAARATLHLWEEPCISGAAGSGAVFFSGCNLRCVFCQNVHIARAKTGKKIPVERLAAIFMELEAKGALNINLVTPTHYVLQIIAALELAKNQGLVLPVVYNTASYEKVETLKLLEGKVDIFLPDFKYLDPDLSRKYSKAVDYPATAKAALKEMVRQAGKPVFDEDGIMKKGVIVRHLMLPGGLEDSKNIIKYLHERYGDFIYISIMNQYTPLPHVKNFPELDRKISSAEYDELLDYAIALGVENAFIQEGGTAEESFIPEFDNEGV
ncbi:radical SAM protein [Acetobacterium tundrae]|uniref:Radical SAM protein n=1 Tax=Acetobacterium tundrae TaxID=132932 RepID=A0ABR6WL93_9FIRM|nr:radical SAM protein [Acetobacterium tundrae]MBC3797280.1 radical SAM protein [Acetobacterium tundrae]